MERSYLVIIHLRNYEDQYNTYLISLFSAIFPETLPNGLRLPDLNQRH